MEDAQIIRLFFERDEAAVSETDKKYGSYCHKIALNILSVHADAEECVNDAYLQAWRSIPPQRPANLGAWLGRVVRNLAINLWNKNHSQKRYAGMELLLQELEDCLPAPATVEHAIEEQELSLLIDCWLASLPADDRIPFVRRYWYGIPLKTLAAECGVLPGRMAKRMYRLRHQLRKKLETEGYTI